MRSACLFTLLIGLAVLFEPAGGSPGNCPAVPGDGNPITSSMKELNPGSTYCTAEWTVNPSNSHDIIVFCWHKLDTPSYNWKRSIKSNGQGYQSQYRVQPAGCVAYDEQSADWSVDIYVAKNFGSNMVYTYYRTYSDKNAIVSSFDYYAFGEDAIVELTVGRNLRNLAYEEEFFLVGLCTGSSCCNSPDGFDQIASPIGSTTTAVVSLGPLAAANYKICASPDGGQTFYEQTGNTMQVKANPSPTVLSITGNGPPYVAGVDKTPPNPTFSGITTYITSYMAFSLPGACAEIRYGETYYGPGSNSLTFSENVPEPGDYVLCYSHNNGIDWVEQTGIGTMQFVRTTEDDVVDVAPRNVGAGVNTPGTIDVDLSIEAGTIDVLVSVVGGSSDYCGEGTVTVSPSSCGGEKIVAIAQAYYGDPDYADCTPTASTPDCGVDVTDLVREICLGKQLCTINIGTDLEAVGSPCGGGEQLVVRVVCDSCSSGTVLGPTASLSSVTIPSSLTAGYYGVCLKRNLADDDYVIQSSPGAAINVLAPSSSSIVAVHPQRMGESSSPAFMFGGLVPTPTTRVALAASTCVAPLAPTVTTVSGAGFPVVLNGDPGPNNYLLCLSHGTSTYTEISGLAVFVADKEPDSLGTSPTTIVAGGQPTLTFPSAEPTDTGTIIRIASDTGCTASEIDYSYTGSGTLLAPVLGAGTYYVCYSVNDGGSFHRVPNDDITVVTVGTTEVTAVDPNPIYLGDGGSFPTLTFTGGSPYSTETFVSFVADGISDPNDCADAAAGPVNLNAATATFTAALTAGQAFQICYSASGSSAGNFVIQSATFDVYAAATATDVSSVSVTAPTVDYLINGASGVAMTVTLAVSPIPPNAMVGLAEDGRCSSTRLDEAAYGSGSISGLSVSVTPGLSGSVTIYTCFSADGVTWVQQTNAATEIDVAVNHNFVITAVNPNIFIASSSPTVTHTGLFASTSTWVGVVAKGTDPCSTTPTERQAVTSGLTATYATPPSGVDMTICYSITGQFGTYIEQKAITITETTDPNAGLITDNSPVYVGAGTTPTVSLTWSPFTAGDVAVALPGTCSGTVYSQTTWSTDTDQALSSALPTPAASGTSYSLCFFDTSWSEQVTSGVEFVIVDATATTLESVTPASGPVSTTDTYTFTFTTDDEIATPDTEILACSTTSCGSVFDTIPLTSGSSVSITLPGTEGTVYLCVDTGNGPVHQTGVSIEAVAALPGSISALDPAVVPENYDSCATVSGPGFSAGGYIGLSPTGVGCAAPTYEFIYDGSVSCNPTAITLPSSVAAGVYDLCYSVDSGTAYVNQTATRVTVVGATASDIVSVAPGVIGSYTTPTLTVTGGTTFATSYLAFHFSSDCDPVESLRGFTALAGKTGDEVDLGAFLNSGTKYVCYSINYAGGVSGLWTPQTGLTVDVVLASTDSIAAIEPSVIALGTTPDLTFTATGSVPLTPIPLSSVSFVSLGDTCAPGNLRSTTDLDVATQDVQLASSLNTAGVYQLCYSTSDGSFLALQSGPRLTVFAADTLAVSSLAPAYVGRSTAPLITLVDGTVIATPTSMFAFALTTDDCSVPGDRYAETAYTADVPTYTSAALSGPAGTYKLCFSSDGITYYDQDETLELVAPGSTDITAISPNYISARTTPELTAQSALPIATSWLVFVPDGVPCSGAAAVANISLAAGDSAAVLSEAFVDGGLFDACLTHDDGASYVKQTGLELTVTNGTASEAGSFFPAAVGNGTNPTLSLSTGSGNAFPPSPASLALAYLGPSRAGPCDGPFALTTDFKATVAISSYLAPGEYAVCVATDGITYVQQGLSLSVVTASTNSITKLTPVGGYHDGYVPTNVQFAGAVGTATTMVAFADETGGCDSLMVSINNAFVIFDVPVSGANNTARGPLNSGLTFANMSVCYTVDGGESWYDQTAVYATVDSECTELVGCAACHSNSKCSFCLSSEECGPKNSDLNCTADDIIPPGASNTCPRIQTSSVRAPSEGDVVLTLTVSRLTAADDDKYECFFDDAGGSAWSDGTRVSGTEIECVAPKMGDDGETVRQLSLYHRGKAYSTNWIVFQYYICGQFSAGYTAEEAGCSSCYDPSDRPLCGTCLLNNTCTTNATCRGDDAVVPRPWVGDGFCPTITSLSPLSVVFGAEGEKLTVTVETGPGQSPPFYKGGSYEVVFGASGDFEEDVVEEATYVSATKLECEIPTFKGGKKAVTVPIAVRHDGLLYTENEESFLYSPPAEIAEPGSNVVGIVVGSSSGFILLVAAAILCGLLYWRRRQWVLAHTPPPLTQSTRETIVFGKFKDFGGEHDDVRPEINQLVQLLMIPGNHFAYSVTEVTAATEADNVAKSLAVLYESEGMMVEMLMDFIEREVFLCTQQSTLFRTNSFATKMFKTYSKMQGVDYLHDTLGFVLNTELSENKDITFDLKSDDAQMAAFTLLTVCQRIFMRIVKSESDVPPAFRKIFHHVQTCMAEKFPVTSGDIAQVVADQLDQRLNDTSDAFQLGALAYRDVDQLRACITADLEDLAQVIVPMQDRFNNFKTCVATLDDQINVMLKDFDKLEGALVPNSAAARRVLEEHTRAQNSVAVGGFFFLRFLVPAITAPEAYHLVRELPTPDQRKLLVMVGKVVQNLSNGLEFGKKEQHMVKLNEFIVQNRNVMYQLFDKLSTPTDEVIVPCRVPPGVLQSAKFVLFEHVCRSYDKIVDKMMTPTEDPEYDTKCQQICNMFRLQMDAINAKKAKAGKGNASMSFSIASVSSTSQADAISRSHDYGNGITPVAAARAPVPARGSVDGPAVEVVSPGGGQGSRLDDYDPFVADEESPPKFNPNDLLGSFAASATGGNAFLPSSSPEAHRAPPDVAESSSYGDGGGGGGGGYDDDGGSGIGLPPPLPSGPPPTSTKPQPAMPDMGGDDDNGGDTGARSPPPRPTRSGSASSANGAPPRPPQKRAPSVSGRPPAKPLKRKPSVGAPPPSSPSSPAVPSKPRRPSANGRPVPPRRN